MYNIKLNNEIKQCDECGSEFYSNTSKMMSDDNTCMYGDSALNVFSIFEQYH